MPLVNPGAYNLTPDASPLADHLREAFAVRRQNQAKADEEQKQATIQQNQRDGLHALDIRGYADGAQTQEQKAAALYKMKGAISRFAREKVENGANPKAWEGLLNATSLDELNLGLTRLATNSANADKLLQERLKPQEQFEPIYNPDGQVVAQKNLQTGELIDGPAAMSGAKLGKNGNKPYPPVTLVDADGNKRLVSPVVNTTDGTGSLVDFEVPDGWDLSTETPEEERAAEILAAALKKQGETRVKGEEDRKINKIAAGQDAALQLGGLYRAVDLLHVVETGGVDRAAQSIKRFFGVESEDEGELSFLMSKAVLSQLKATFGAQFTEKEGQRLEGIEASFTKSPAANRRLLTQTIRIMERAAKRGAKAARDVGDIETAEEIEGDMKFRFQDTYDEPVRAPATQAGGQKIGRFTVQVVE